jgi:chromate transporter
VSLRVAAALHPLPLVLAASAFSGSLAWVALKVGALSYGGGFVIVPLMQGDALAHDWLTHAEFGNAVAYGQLTPGPVTHTIAFIGWGAAGLPGALLASAIAFLPSFLFVMLGGDHFEAVRERPGPRAFLDGAGPAAIGAILGAAVLLATALEEWWQAAVVVAAAVLLALGRSPLPVLLAGAAAGVVITTIT